MWILSQDIEGIIGRASIYNDMLEVGIILGEH
jgi:hypothetical protein